MINYNKIAEKYSHHRKLHPGVLKNLIEKGKNDSHSKILEVGCGTGNYISSIADLIKCTCWGIDPSQKMLNIAQKNSDNVKLKKGFAEKIDFMDNFFDTIFSVDVIHHITDKEKYFNEAFRTLKINGKICTVTDSEWIIKNRKPLSEYFPEIIEAELNRYPSIKYIKNIMKSVGFKKISEFQVEFSYKIDNIQPYVDKSFSCLHLISNEAFNKGIEKMKSDLKRKSFIEGISRYLLIWGIKK
ncbi:MAG: methyltransferase domain-containing protein [Elusimicrobiota bacterium]